MTTRTIVVASEGHDGLEGFVSSHLGRCNTFTVVRAEDGRVVETRVVNNPYAVDHHPGAVPRLVRGLGADAVIAGGMGPRAATAFERKEIEVVTGVEGRIGGVVAAFLEGTLRGSAPCRHGEDCGGEGHGHHHVHGHGDGEHHGHGGHRHRRFAGTGPGRGEHHGLPRRRHRAR